MKNTKLSLRKITITKLNNLSKIKGGSLLNSNNSCSPFFTFTCPDTGTKTHEQVLKTEDLCL
ncbi:hypothetical protein [Aquimarina aggregata]|uniref:hypothetical protein n=1 Tax=Aquimarina aggregata TaxID=1642818 RepID=UPI002490FCEA|nr:hypothetical protein [Aquimarina aggregata]